MAEITMKKEADYNSKSKSLGSIVQSPDTMLPQ
jgi:hypothetical protein